MNETDKDWWLHGWDCGYSATHGINLRTLDEDACSDPSGCGGVGWVSLTDRSESA